MQVAPAGSGDAKKWVAEHLETELKQWARLGRRKPLIVMTDADNLSVQGRRGETLALLPAQDHPALVVLVPKWSVETWILAALGDVVHEEETYKSRKRGLEGAQTQTAALTIYEWSRSNATLGPTCVPSLHAALPEWGKLG
ncbi:MAG: hypothetical protein ABI743_02495 [bacterium]